VNQGTAYANNAYQCTVLPGGTLETTDITWASFGAVAVNFSVDNFTDSTDYTSGTTTTLVITTDCSSEENLRVSFDGVMQHHNTYTYTSGTRTITFDAAIPLGTANVEAQYGSTITVGTPSDGTVSTAKLADLAVTTGKLAAGAVTAAKLNAAVITGQTDGTVAAGDSFLFSDVDAAGALKDDTVQGILDLVPAGGTDGGWEFVSLTTISADATVAFTGFVTGYDYLVQLIDVKPSVDGAQTRFQVGVAGPTYRATNYSATAGTVSAALTKTTYFPGSDGHGAAADEEGTFTLLLYDPAAATRTWVDGSIYFKNTAGSIFVGQVGGKHTVAESMVAVKFFYSSGNVASGIGKLYKRPNA
jgi:hypothetical protein